MLSRQYSTPEARASTAPPRPGATLDAVKRKGYVQCGVSDGLPGFSY
ncbi:ABC transporter substrate-binding protein, partial [Pseudomonas aeruginosa]